LIVITGDRGIGKATRNLLGANVCRVENLSAEYLAPGAAAGRLTIWSKDSIEKLAK
jgi:large subunit ribosomal protein L4e